MFQGFAFDFNSDDGDSARDIDMLDERDDREARSHSSTRLIIPKYHAFDELLPTLPATISYAYHNLALSNGSTVCLPRRELFDIRAQAMAEADPSAPSITSSEDRAARLTADLAAGLSTDDIVSGVYEGGFKTWECALDLARFVLGLTMEETPGAGGEWRLSMESRDLHIIELGAGTALSSSALLFHLLTRPLPTAPSSTSPPFPPSVRFTVADYNTPVLCLSTLPNLFLTALSALSLLLPESDASALDIEPSHSLTSALRSELGRRNVTVGLISGQWGSKFVETVQQIPSTLTSRDTQAPHSSHPSQPLVLILASETIYSPASLRSFAETVVGLMREAKSRGAETRAFVAAKRVYFGVGGGVIEFERVLEALGGRTREAWASEVGGVGRCIVEVVLD